MYTNEVGSREHKIWDHSSAGRASALQAEVIRFEPIGPIYTFNNMAG